MLFAWICGGHNIKILFPGVERRYTEDAEYLALAGEESFAFRYKKEWTDIDRSCFLQPSSELEYLVFKQTMIKRYKNSISYRKLKEMLMLEDETTKEIR